MFYAFFFAGPVKHMLRRDEVGPDDRLAAVMIGFVADAKIAADGLFQIPPHEDDALLPVRCGAMRVGTLVLGRINVHFSAADHLHIASPVR